jgi:hypothetical protein
MRWTSLRARMTISYVAVTVGPVLTFSLFGVLAAAVYTVVVPAPDALSSDVFTAVQRQAHTYAVVAAYQVQGPGAALDPRTNFVPGQAHTIAVTYQDALGQAVFAPYIATGSPDPTTVSIAVLVAPDGRVVASSYPARYPSTMDVSALTPAQVRAIRRALGGQASSGSETSSPVTLAMPRNRSGARIIVRLARSSCRSLGPRARASFHGCGARSQGSSRCWWS